MASYKVKFAASATPIETLTANDGTTAVSLVHSDIDKSIGGGIELACGSTAANLSYKQYLATDTGVALNAAAIGNATITGVEMLIVKIVKAKDSSATAPDCYITVDGTTYEHLLSGIGDCCLLRLDNLAGADILFKSTATTGECYVDIMWAAPA
jgi:hypothetical protein